MLEFLMDREVMLSDEFEGAIQSFNPDTKKLIVLGEDKDGNEETRELDLFASSITQNIDYYDDWQHKLYTALIRNEGKVNIQFLSTESADTWGLDIYRHKTLLPTHEYGEQIILTNYVIVFNDEIKGDIFTRRYQRYSGCAIDEEKEFCEWIEEQIEKVSEFNSTSYWSLLEGIIVSDAFNSDEEIELLWSMFNEQNE